MQHLAIPKLSYDGTLRQIQIRCKYHPNADLIEDFTAGDVVCPVCGLVVGDRVIDFSSEWRSFANDGNGEDASRVGAVEDNLNPSSASITIKSSYDPRYLDENGNQKYKNRISISSTERMLSQCRNHIQTIAVRLNANSKTINHAMAIVQKLTKIKEFTRKNKEDIACACLFFAFREQKVERSFKEIGSVSKSSVKDIGKTFKKIMAALGVETQTSNLTDQMARFCYNLQLKNKFVHKLAVSIVNEAKKFIFKKPSTMIATSIYMACYLMKEEMTKKRIFEIVDVTENTISSAYKLFYKHRFTIIPSSVLPKLLRSIHELPES